MSVVEPDIGGVEPLAAQIFPVLSAIRTPPNPVPRACGHERVRVQGMAGQADGGVNPDRKITVKELEAYLNDRVPELTEEHRGSVQYPNSYAVGQDFPIVTHQE